eukprot:gene4439-6278_t
MLLSRFRLSDENRRNSISSTIASDSPTTSPRPLPPFPSRTDTINSNVSVTSNSNNTYQSSSPNNSASNNNDQIKVCVRIRPLIGSNTSEEDVAWTWDENTIFPNNNVNNSYLSANANIDFSYTFDHLFHPHHTNQQIFSNVVQNIVSSAMDGYHGSVFSYGQTSSGKTFTMNGNSQQIGIIPQAVRYCFDSVNYYPDREFLFRVSYMEVYNEQVKDLLGIEPVPIKIQHDPKLGTVISGIKEQVVLNPQQVLALIKSGEAHRHVGSTDMNEKSSRAHTLFKIIIESRERASNNNPNSPTKSAPVKVSTLNLVDLAGSESAKMTNSKGERAKEARYINQSLLTLSTIIQRLSEDRQAQNNISPNRNSSVRKQHLPYRDSKLTRILESALDGNALIAIICTISPAAKCFEETNNTLKFAARAKLIKMSAKVNETVDDKTLLRAYRMEIEQLKEKLRQLESQSTPRANGAISMRSHPSMEFYGDDNSYSGNSIPASDEDDAAYVLQMIEEMERLILKADSNKLNKNNNKPTSNRDSFGSIISLGSVKSFMTGGRPDDSDSHLSDSSPTIRQPASHTISQRFNQLLFGSSNSKHDNNNSNVTSPVSTTASNPPTDSPEILDSNPLKSPSLLHKSQSSTLSTTKRQYTTPVAMNKTSSVSSIPTSKKSSLRLSSITSLGKNPLSNDRQLKNKSANSKGDSPSKPSNSSTSTPVIKQTPKSSINNNSPKSTLNKLMDTMGGLGSPNKSKSSSPDNQLGSPLIGETILNQVDGSDNNNVFSVFSDEYNNNDTSEKLFTLTKSRSAPVDHEMYHDNNQNKSIENDNNSNANHLSLKEPMNDLSNSLSFSRDDIHHHHNNNGNNYNNNSNNDLSPLGSDPLSSPAKSPISLTLRPRVSFTVTLPNNNEEETPLLPLNSPTPALLSPLLSNIKKAQMNSEQLLLTAQPITDAGNDNANGNENDSIDLNNSLSASLGTMRTMKSFNLTNDHDDNQDHIRHDDEDIQVGFRVTQMLSVLKEYVSK